MTTEEKRKLLEQSKCYERLSYKQLLNLIVWDILKPKKMETFYNSLSIGKHVWAAYDDAYKN